MDREEAQRWLDKYKSAFNDPVDRKKVELTLEWVKDFEPGAGVYVIFEKGKPIYVGETKSIPDRMNDLRKTYNHTLRRSIGAAKFSALPGYVKASSHKKFPDEIEKKLDAAMCRLEVKALTIGFGRKEVEEYLIKAYDNLYNGTTKRGV